MKWIRCRRRQEASLLAAGALGEEEAVEVERHLAACQECRSFYGEIKALTAPLAAWEKSLSAVEATPAARTRWAGAIGMAARDQSAASRNRNWNGPQINTDLHRYGKALAKMSEIDKEQCRERKGELLGQDGRVGSGFLNPVNPGLPRRSLAGGWVHPVRIFRVLLRSFAAKLSSQFVINAGRRVVWGELIRPNRRAWTGMAALWAAMLVINAHLADHRTSGPGARAASSREIIQTWEEQNRVLAELTQPAMFHASPANPPLAPANPPRPRSERKQAWQIV